MRYILKITIFLLKYSWFTMFYNIVLITTIQQSDSVIHIFVYIFLKSFPLWFIIGILPLWHRYPSVPYSRTLFDVLHFKEIFQIALFEKECLENRLLIECPSYQESWEYLTRHWERAWTKQRSQCVESRGLRWWLTWNWGTDTFQGWSLTACYTSLPFCVCRRWPVGTEINMDGCGSQWVSLWLDKPVAGQWGDAGRSEWKRLVWEGWKLREHSFEGAVRMPYSPRQLWFYSHAFVLSYLRGPRNLPASAVQTQEWKAEPETAGTQGDLPGGGADWPANWEGVSGKGKLSIWSFSVVSRWPEWAVS